LAILVPEQGIFLQGWLVDSEAPVKALALETKEGTKIQFKYLLFPYPRPDVYQDFQARGIELANDNLGFSCLVPLPSEIENLTSVTIVAEFLAGGDRRFSFPITQPTANPLPLIQQILNYVDSHSSQVEKYLDDCIAPTVSVLWQGRKVAANVQEVVEYGQPVNQPAVSVIVPLYGRIDFVKVQLSLFADDPDFQENELIYILDDPRLSEELQKLASQVFSLFEVPFKVIYTGKNLGYAGANNLAVTQAKGKYLILLNSDVMPKQDGWITALKTAYQSLPKVGAIAPKLLFEDESIQHAGIIPYRLPPYRYLWFNSHPGKGLPGSLMAESSPTQMPAVTGACMMVERELYLQQEGLSEDYILGDFEDSDFCFQLHQLGLQNYYIPTVEMYHLERQSQILIGESCWRQSLTLYNAWVHTKRWDSLIREMLVSEPGIKNKNE
jgi:GT2 family glycosyltransferase